MTEFVLSVSAQQALNDIEQNPPHAALLSGPHGSGKTHHARTLALRLLMETDSENTANLRTISPQNGSISIEQIRALIKFFRLKVPSRAAIQRVAIIEDAETMGLEAQNALLKVLEEPPQGSVLLLTSSDPQTLLPTIRSRVQSIYLPTPSTTELASLFMAQGKEPAAVQSALLRAGSDIAEAVRLLQDDQADETMQSVRQALSGSTYERLLLVDNLSKHKETATLFVQTLATVASVSLNVAARNNPQNIPRWKTILQAAYTAQTALSLNGNTKLVLSELMLAM